MAAPLQVITHGRAGFYDGPVRKTRSVRGLDALSGVWISDYANAIVEGQPAPEWPGMIIDQVEEQQDAGSYRYSIQALGSLSNTKPDKRIGGGERRSLEAGFDEARAEYISWRHAEKPCTGASATNLITCPGHRFQNGDVVWFASKTGGSSLALKTDYHVRDVDPNAGTLKLSATAGGAAAALGSDITDGSLVLKLFARGSTHPDHAYMYLIEAAPTDSAMDWANVPLSYKGIIGSKRYKRTVSLEGQTISGESIAINPTLFPGGWADFRASQIDIPKLVVEDLEVFTTHPDFTEPPASNSPPPDAPDLNLDFGLATGDLTHFWPNQWAYKGLRIVDDIPGCSLYLVLKRWEYVFPAMVKG